MDPVTGAAVIGGGANLIGSIAQSVMGSGEARKNRKFQEHMSATAHQREVQDLIKAGLNPLLSAGGSGASQPAGAMYNPSNPGEGIERAVKGIGLERAQRKLTNQQEEVAKSQKLELDTKKQLNAALANSAKSQKQLLDQQKFKTAEEVNLIQNQIEQTYPEASKAMLLDSWIRQNPQKALKFMLTKEVLGVARDVPLLRKLF